MKPVRFQLDDVIVEASHGESVLDACLRKKLPLDHSCGGNASCGTCRVIVVSGAAGLASPNELESEMIADRGFAPDERLACQTEPVPGLRLRRPRP